MEVATSAIARNYEAKVGYGVGRKVQSLKGPHRKRGTESPRRRDYFMPLSEAPLKLAQETKIRKEKCSCKPDLGPACEFRLFMP